jgi:cytochrome c oxidase subunit 2
MVTESLNVLARVLTQTGIVPGGTRTFVFERIFTVFLGLGALVGAVVIGYMLYNAYKYRDDGSPDDGGVDRPSLGELPEGGGKGKKLFLSFALSTVIVISLIAWTYGALLFVEDTPSPEESMVVEVEGYQFGWEFIYPNGHRSNTLRVPAGEEVLLEVTSRDVFHNFGVPGLRIKSDAIPGQTTTTWFIEEDTGTYTAQCYELCGAGHSYMTADVVVMEPDEFDEWYAGTDNSSSQ